MKSKNFAFRTKISKLFHIEIQKGEKSRKETRYGRNKKMHKIAITMVKTRVLRKEFEVSDEEYNKLNDDGDLDSECLNEMFSDIADSKYASTEYDYAVCHGPRP